MPSSRAGNRTRRYTPGYGKLSSDRVAWLRTVPTQQIAISLVDPIGVLDKEDPDFEEKAAKSEKGDNVLLMMTVSGRRTPLTWNMSAMTTEELEATRQFFNHLFDLADPIVRERDKVAEDAYNKGDDSYTRSYRQLPQLVIRSRQESADSESLHDGSPDAPLGDGD